MAMLNGVSSLKEKEMKLLNHKKVRKDVDSPLPGRPLQNVRFYSILGDVTTPCGKAPNRKTAPKL